MGFRANGYATVWEVVPGNEIFQGSGYLQAEKTKPPVHTFRIFQDIVHSSEQRIPLQISLSGVTGYVLKRSR